MVGTDDNSVFASSDRYRLEAHYEIAVSTLSLEAVHDETGLVWLRKTNE